MGAQFSRFVIFCRFLCFWETLRKQQFYLHGSSILENSISNFVFSQFFENAKKHVGWVFGPAGLQDPPTRPQDTSKPRFWHYFRGILDRFCKDCWYNFGSVFYEKRCFTCMGAHFSKVSPYFVVSFLLAGISEIAVLPAWELIFREFA